MCQRPQKAWRPLTERIPFLRQGRRGRQGREERRKPTVPILPVVPAFGLKGEVCHRRCSHRAASSDLLRRTFRESSSELHVAQAKAGGRFFGDINATHLMQCSMPNRNQGLQRQRHLRPQQQLVQVVHAHGARGRGARGALRGGSGAAEEFRGGVALQQAPEGIQQGTSRVASEKCLALLLDQLFRNPLHRFQHAPAQETPC
mmetsp:Transcript_1090/g.2431  ORF Transcript_1090/g.2431 Transcript_1090/m.2431 type:complete len:202 (+) Transcript_1090:598-1203(+)